MFILLFLNKEKIQNYDIKQLIEQIELLKQANKGK